MNMENLSRGARAVLAACTAFFLGRRAREEESKRSDVERHGTTRRPWIRRQCSGPIPGVFELRASAFPRAPFDAAGALNAGTAARWKAHERRERRAARRARDHVRSLVGRVEQGRREFGTLANDGTILISDRVGPLGWVVVS